MNNSDSGGAGRGRAPIHSGALLMIVLAMLMVFAAITLRWGLAPGVAVAMTLALGTAAARIVRNTMR